MALENTSDNTWEYGDPWAQAAQYSRAGYEERGPEIVPIETGLLHQYLWRTAELAMGAFVDTDAPDTMQPTVAAYLASCFDRLERREKPGQELSFNKIKPIWPTAAQYVVENVDMLYADAIADVDKKAGRKPYIPPPTPRA